jgi:uncharacterized membrane protein
MESIVKPESIESLKKQFTPPVNVNVIHRNRLSRLDRLAIFVTEKIGTMGFFFIILGWTVIWLGWNILAPAPLRFDPYPAFVLWLFISNLIQIHLMPLIMIGQNIQGKHAELRSEHDFETDKKAEKEIETILLHLELQQKLMLDILRRLEKLEERK